MANRVSLNVSLTPELEQFISARVSSGRYQTASEVVREGLRLLEEREERQRSALQELRELVAAGLEEAKRGELLDGEQVMADLLRRHEERLRVETGESQA
jgi:antitoxin ParD1/3/4